MTTTDTFQRPHFYTNRASARPRCCQQALIVLRPSRYKATLHNLIDQVINAGLIALIGCSIAAALAIGAPMPAAGTQTGPIGGDASRPTSSSPPHPTSRACSAWSATSMRRLVKAGAGSPNRCLATIDRAGVPMITFILSAAVLVGALCVAVALDGATTEAPPGVVAPFLAARLLAADQTVPVALGCAPQYSSRKHWMQNSIICPAAQLPHPSPSESRRIALSTQPAIPHCDA